MKIFNVNQLQHMSATIRILIFVFPVLSLFRNASAQAPDSLDIKIGQMILIGFPKPEVDTMVLGEIKEGKAGSIIMFEKNIPPTNSFIALKKILWTYQHAATIPL